MKILIRPKGLLLGVLCLIICLYGISPYSMTNDINTQFYTTIIIYIMLVLFFPNELVSILFNKKYIYAYLYPAFLFLCYFNSWSVLGEAVFSLINTTIPLVLFIMMENEEEIWINRINRITAMYIVVICVFTLYMLRNNPLICRLLAHYRYWENLNTTELFLTGGFDFIYSLVLISGVLLHYSREAALPKYLRRLFLVYYILCVICVLASSYTAALLLICLESLCIFYFSLVNKSRTHTIIFVLLSLFLILFFFNLGPFFSALKVFSPSEAVTSRLDDLSQFFSGEGLGSGDVLGRSVVYGYSIKTWLEHFWFGVGYSEYSTLGKHGIGGHSELLDHLGYYGTIGTMFFLLALFKTKNVIMSFIRDENKYIYRIVFYVFIVELVMNLGYTATFINSIFLIIPALMYGMERKIEKQRTVKNELSGEDV